MELVYIYIYIWYIGIGILQAGISRVLFWVLVTAAVFFGLLSKCYIFKFFIFSTVFLGPVLFSRYFSKQSSSSLLYRA